ncbi:MAG: serine hydrolase [Gammaproteobacteria bacterium]|nr:serine hydrolase [Gammaproteobacteria bacterium]
MHKTTVENGLTTGVQVEGAEVLRLNILDRMAFHIVPSVSVAVVDGGKLDFAETYNLDAGDRIDPETQIQAGSISKPIAAVVALQLVERGMLNLDEDVNDKLTSWKVPESEFTSGTEKVTLRRLLSHTAGTNVHGFMGYKSSEAIPALLQVLEGAAPANSDAVVSERVPGEKREYSGGGFEIIQQLIEDVTSRKFSEVAKEFVFDPLGMSRSTYEIIRPGVESTDNMAKGHESNGGLVEGDWHLHPESAAAGLWTTPSDLVKFILAIQNHTLLSEAMTRDMLQKQIKNELSEFGLGFQINARATTFGHAGVNIGFQSEMVGFISEGKAAVVMTNSDNGLDIAPEIIRSIAEAYGWSVGHGFEFETKKIIALDPAILPSYEGRYTGGTPDGEAIQAIISLEGGQLQLSILAPGSDTSLQLQKLGVLLPET